MRAHRWFAAKALDTPSRMTMPTPGDIFASMTLGDVIKLLPLLLAAVSLAAPACDYPDQGNLPLRRAVTRVKLLPETEAWAAGVHEAGGVVQYALLLEQPKLDKGRCYWTVEVRAAGQLWRRFYVSPDGKALLKK
jgi:hypothetical protein